MVTYVFDGTLPGLMTTCAYAYDTGELPDTVILPSESQPLLLGDIIEIQTDHSRADAFAVALKKRGGKRSVKHLSYCYLAEDEDVLKDSVIYACGVIQHGRRMDAHHAHPSVAKVHEVSRKVGGEIHRLTGLLRFRELRDGTYFAPCAPDFNIVAPLSLHFRARLGDQKWVIYDVKRDIGVSWDIHELTYVTANEEIRKAMRSCADVYDDALSDTEKIVQSVWRRYFKEISVGGRENERVQKNFMPVRYWAYLVERPRSSRTIRRAK